MKPRHLFSLLLHTAVVVLAWQGVHGTGAAYNLLRFWVWISFVISFGVMVMSDKERRKLSVQIKSPPWISGGSDLAVIVILAASGWFFSAALYLFNAFAEVSLRAAKDQTP